jgi:predicted ATPase
VNVTGTEAGAVTGETPNLAARLQSVAGPGEVIISDGTRRLTGAAFEIESRGTYALRGFSDPVQGYAVLGEREVESRFEAMRGAQISPLVGRVHEIGLLAERWKQTQVGHGTVVLLSGEAGIGKSRLIEAMAKQVSEDGGEIIRLQCSPYFASSALHPVIERIRRAAGIAQADDASAQLVKLRDLLAKEGGYPETKLRIYAGLLSIEMPPDSADPDLMPEELKELTLQVLLERPIKLSRKAPLLLVLEDAHWIDPSTLELMERLVARAAELPVMIVVTHRPEWSTDWSGTFGHVTALTVGRLDRSQIAELMEKTFGYPPPPDLVDDIAQRTEGVPLFIEEFCQAIAGQTDADAAAEVTIPATLQGSLMSRLDRLPRAARSLALVASVIGREFDSTLLRQVTGFTSAALEEGLAALRQMQVIFASGSSSGSYLFRHALIQDTAYQSLLKRTRQSHHGAVARTLETHHPEILAREPELIAHHYAAAGDDSAARPLWMLLKR